MGEYTEAGTAQAVSRLLAAWLPPALPQAGMAGPRLYAIRMQDGIPAVTDITASAGITAGASPGEAVHALAVTLHEREALGFVPQPSLRPDGIHGVAVCFTAAAGNTGPVQVMYGIDIDGTEYTALRDPGGRHVRRYSSAPPGNDATPDAAARVISPPVLSFLLRALAGSGPGTCGPEPEM